MQRKRMLRLWLLCFQLIFLADACAGSDVGKGLERALQSRETGSVEEVIRFFYEAAAKASRPEQKASILSFLADFLMKNKKWHEAVEVYQHVLQEGSENDKPWAYYGKAQAYYLLNDHVKAQSLCVELVTKYPGSSMEAFAREMKLISPSCIHARLAVFMILSPLIKAHKQVPEITSENLKSDTNLVSEKKIASLKPGKIMENSNLSLSIHGWQSDVTGEINARGMDLNLENDTDINPKTAQTARAEWQISDKNQIKFDYSQLNFNGTLMRKVVYDNLAYTPGASVRLKTNFFDFGLSHLFDENKRSVWEILCGVKFSNLFMKIEQQMVSGTRAGELDQNFRVPYLGIGSSNKLSDNLSLNAAIKYFAFNSGGIKANTTDFDVTFLFGRDYAKNPSTKEWYGLLGYRYFLMRGKSGGDLSEVTYSGPTLGVESRF